VILRGVNIFPRRRRKDHRTLGAPGPPQSAPAARARPTTIRRRDRMTQPPGRTCCR
jgi:hypothetical protein